ncbi:SYM1 [Scenedesmus sp. PABB004]|nr:SYM1 [Scenedesmus sp. PABB004]
MAPLRALGARAEARARGEAPRRALPGAPGTPRARRQPASARCAAPGAAAASAAAPAAAAAAPPGRAPSPAALPPLPPPPPPLKSPPVIHTTAYLQQQGTLVVPELPAGSWEESDAAAAALQRAGLDDNALVWALRKVDDQLNAVEARPSQVHQAIYKLSTGPVGQATSAGVQTAAKLTMTATLGAAKAAAPVGKWALAAGFKAAAGLVGAAMAQEQRAKQQEKQQQKAGGGGSKGARNLVSGGSWGGWGRHPLQQQRARAARLRRRAASGDALSNKGSYWERVQGLQGPLKAGLISGSLSAAGDLLAQFLTAHFAQSGGAAAPAYDAARTARMAGFGAAFYGPYQFYWYNLLDWLMPLRSTPNFLAKVTANQLLLAPVTLAVVFAWNLGLTGQGAAVPAKIQNDLVPAMVNGWKFWVPAASLNFCAVPLRHQVLYMSCCGMLWTAYLSYISTVAVRQPAPAPAPAGRGRRK